MNRKITNAIIVFVLTSMLAGCITAPILYNKAVRDSKTTVPNTSTNATAAVTATITTLTTTKTTSTTTTAPTTTTTTTPTTTSAPTTTTPSTTTTTYNTKNPCFEHQCGTGETCFEIDEKATCVSGTIGFLTHDKLVIYVKYIS